MAAKRAPTTAAVRAMRAARISYSEHLFDYETHPGALGAAEAIGVDSHAVVKTLVMATDNGAGVLVLMHGDRKVSTKALARLLGVKRVGPADGNQARRWTGYEFGGTSPFGTRKALPIYAEETIADLPRAYLNAGRRGFLVGLDPREMLVALEAKLVSVAE
jgi:Cys-tRNA(Pro) deacylase